MTEEITTNRLATDFLHAAKIGTATAIVGAGVSMLGNTKLPSGSQLRDAVIQAILGKQLLKKYWPYLSVRGSRFDSVVPELLFEKIHSIVGQRLVAFFQLLRLATPNRGHHVLANIATSDGLLLLTTNFDLLLETAGCPPNRIQHLHGAIDAPDTMKFRLNLVGRGLRGQKQRVGAVALKGRSLFVFGYSFNDEDIRQLVKGSPPVSLYWHLKNKQDWALRNISLLKSVKTPIFLSFGDLHAVFDSLAGNVAPWSIHTSANPFKLPRQNLIAEASRNIVNHEREAILAVCLTEAHCGDGLKALKKRIFDRPRCRLDVETYLALTIGFRTLRMASECLSCCQRALALLSEADGCVFARAWNLLGLYYLERKVPDIAQAIVHFLRAKDILVRIGTKDANSEQTEILLSLVLNNLGLIELENTNNTEAVRYFKESLRIKRRLGMLEGISQTAVNLCLAYQKNGRSKRVAYWRRIADDLIEKYDLLFQRAYLNRELGASLVAKGNKRRGRQRLLAALNDYEVLESSQGIKLTRAALKQAGAT